MKEIIFDIGHKETEELLKQTEKRIENVYRQAYKELKKKSDDYMSQFLKTDAEKRKAMQAGEITKDEYRQWRQSHLLTGRRWVSMQESIAKDLNNSNQIAASVINGHLPDVYAININWATYQLEHDFMIDTSFTLYDRQTMERLLRDDPDLLPWQAKINTPEDIRYQKRHLNSAMMQGILQGETIPQISERLASSPCRMNARNAVTNARTMYTSAQNGGRIDGYKRAEGMGIHLKKQWLATLDGRTRHEHRQLDGQIVGTDESFEVDGYEIEFPGDPKAAAEMVYNCRCTMRSVLDALDKGGYTEYEKNGKLGDMSYEEWKNEHSKKENTNEFVGGETYNNIVNSLIRNKVEFIETKALEKQLTENEIIDKLAGGDMTRGSCSSLAFAYAGNKGGIDVIDFRGGDSLNYFSKTNNIKQISLLNDVKAMAGKHTNDFKVVTELLKTVENNKEYILVTGAHSAVVRKGIKGFEYLEMQRPDVKGFLPLTTDALKRRFGCKKSHSVSGYKIETSSILFDRESLSNSEEFKHLLGYINTPEEKQKKGMFGYAK